MRLRLIQELIFVTKLPYLTVAVPTPAWFQSHTYLGRLLGTRSIGSQGGKSRTTADFFRIAKTLRLWRIQELIFVCQADSVVCQQLRHARDVPMQHGPRSFGGNRRASCSRFTFCAHLKQSVVYNGTEWRERKEGSVRTAETLPSSCRGPTRCSAQANIRGTCGLER